MTAQHYFFLALILPSKNSVDLNPEIAIQANRNVSCQEKTKLDDHMKI